MSNIFRNIMKVAVIAVVLAIGALSLPSCYQNKADIVPPDRTVSFIKDVVPIYTSGGCGCHNMSRPTNTVISGNKPVLFSNGGYKGVDTILYDGILARTNLMNTWVNGGAHPGGGPVFLSVQETYLIKNWIEQGAQDDRNAAPVSGNVTYAANVAPIINTTCNAASCHGGAAVALSLASLTSHSSHLTAYVSDGQWTNHSGGKQSSSVTATIKAWIQQGMK